MNMSDYEKKCEDILNYLCQEKEPGKKMVQKLMYLIERKGVSLNLNYSIHFYGPYSAVLDNELHMLVAQGVVEIVVEGATHKIKSKSQTSDLSSLSPEEVKIVEEIQRNFGDKTALELEAMTTLDYVAHTLLDDKGDIEQVVGEVKKIKGKKFDVKYLRQEYDKLKEFNFIS